MIRGRGRRIAVLATAALATVLLAGCTETAPNAVTPGPGPWAEYSHPTTPVVSFSGPLLGGGTFSSAAHKGEVLVVNFWYAGCGPCQAEAPSLDALAKKFAGQKVQFVGVNVRDQSGTAQPFVEQYGVPYPVILDQDNRSAAQLAFASSVPPTTTPTTVVVGLEGRVTGSYLGQADSDILTTMIQAALSGRDA